MVKIKLPFDNSFDASLIIVQPSICADEVRVGINDNDLQIVTSFPNWVRCSVLVLFLLLLINFV